ncbi:hypothetical protein CYMTET_29528 [Cymbomonas tetramitiformis]|nr:hypothetical protein CYMTET_29528 [Cymbomonas tetramitiformis]
MVIGADQTHDTREWISGAAGAGFKRLFLLYSNQIGEARGLNRLAGLSSSEVLLLTGDSALPASPVNANMVGTMQAFFQRHPRLAALGWQLGFRPETSSSSDSFTHQPQQVWSTRKGMQINTPIRTHDVVLGVRFMFVHALRSAPVAVRRAAFLQVGSLHTLGTCAGEEMRMSEAELSLRMWLAGWQVGLYHMSLADSTTEGKHVDNKEVSMVLSSMYNLTIPVIDYLVDKANKILLAPV